MKLDEYVISKIRTQMHDKGMNNSALSKATGISEATISRVLRGASIKLSVIDKIVEALNMSVKLELKEQRRAKVPEKIED